MLNSVLIGLSTGWPGAVWSLPNDFTDFDTELEWREDSPKPTLAEVMAAYDARPLPLIERLSAIFESASAGVPDVALRAHFRQLQVAVSFCLSNESPDAEAAQYIIQTAAMPGDTYTEGYTMPEPYQSFKDALLAEFVAV